VIGKLLEFYESNESSEVTKVSKRELERDWKADEITTSCREPDSLWSGNRTLRLYTIAKCFESIDLVEQMDVQDWDDEYG